MIYLLDTNAISALMRKDTRMGSWLSSLLADDRAVINTITRGEILFGLGRLAQGRRRAELEAKAHLVSRSGCHADLSLLIWSVLFDLADGRPFSEWPTIRP